MIDFPDLEQTAKLEKAVLRRELIQRRKEMRDKPQKDSLIFEKLTALPEFTQAELIRTYVSTPLEVDTLQLLDYCFNRRIPVAVPGIVNEKMKFFMLKSMWEIGDEIDCQLSAVNCQLCVVPGLAFDGDGRRLGYGGGYYDRFLRDYPGVKVGLCYEEFKMNIPVEEHDERVDIVL